MNLIISLIWLCLSCLHWGNKNKAPTATVWCWSPYIPNSFTVSGAQGDNKEIGPLGNCWIMRVLTSGMGLVLLWKCLTQDPFPFFNEGPVWNTESLPQTCNILSSSPIFKVFPSSAFTFPFEHLNKAKFTKGQGE